MCFQYQMKNFHQAVFTSCDRTAAKTQIYKLGIQVEHFAVTLWSSSFNNPAEQIDTLHHKSSEVARLFMTIKGNTKKVVFANYQYT